MPALINEYDIIVGQMGERGALGMAELEAMACDKPVVANLVWLLTCRKAVMEKYNWDSGGKRLLQVYQGLPTGVDHDNDGFHPGYV